MNFEEYPIAQRVHSFIYGIYAWMACGLAITAFTAYLVFSTPALYQAITATPGMLFLIVIAQLALVIMLSIYIFRLSLTTALVAFLAYAFLLGIMLSTIFEVYTTASIFESFIAAALMFGGMSLYGYITKTDLTTIGNIALMILFGMIIAMLVNMFFQSPQIDLVISGIGIIIFTLLTAYDVQKLKRIGSELLGEQELMAKVTILGALTLYLDFINLFLFLLRFMGRRRR